MRYIFDQWSDGDKNPSRVLNITSDIVLTALYKEEKDMANVTFKGVVDKQDAEGQPVTITITLPDGTPVNTLSPLTTADGSFTASAPYAAGDYIAKASILKDTQYQPAESTPTPFTVGLLLRTITLNVTVES